MELFLYPTIGGVIYVGFLAAILLEASLYKSRRGKPYPWAEGGISRSLSPSATALRASSIGLLSSASSPEPSGIGASTPCR